MELHACDYSNDTRFKAEILEHLPVGVYFLDYEFRIHWTNALGTRQSHVNWKEHYGEVCYSLPFGLGKQCENCPVAKTLVDGGSHSLEKLMPNGRTWLITSTPAFDGKGEQIGAIETVTDVSALADERSRTLEEMQTRQSKLAAQMAGIKSLHSYYAQQGIDFMGSPEMTVSTVADTLQAKASRLWLKEENAYRCLIQYNAHDNTYSSGHTSPPYVRDFFKDYLESGEQLLVADVLDSYLPEEMTAYYLAQGFRSMLCCPVRAGTTLIGLLVVADAVPRQWMTEEQSFVMAVADFTALCINRHHSQMYSRQLDTLLANLPGAAFRMRYGENGVRFEYLSDGCRELAGFTLRDTENAPGIMKRAVHPEDYAAYHALHMKPDSGDGLLEIIYRLVPEHGAVRWVLERSKIIAANRDDNTITFEGFAHDITERMKLREAEMANEAKGRFLAAMSHEIRTPLNAIIGFTHLIRHTEMDEMQSEYLGKVQGSADILLELINTILDYSKIEAGRMETSQEPFNIADAMASLRAMLEQQAAQKDLKFTTTVARNVPCYLIGDSLHFKQVLINLVGNAVKFTDAGKVAVRCETLEKKGTDITLKVTVRDTGIGMSEEELDRVFVPFAQADNSSSRKYGGTGLGLSIAKSLVEIMGGTIAAASAPGKGTTFTFTASMKQDTARQAVRDAGRLVVPRFRGQDVLLVEDNAINRQMASVLLRHANLRAVEAQNGKEALELMAERQKPFALVLMDIQMPVMDGLQATRHIRAAEEKAGNGRRIPIVAMTAHALDSERRKCAEAGMDGHISKPIDVVYFYSTLSEHLEREKVLSQGLLPM